MQLIYAWSDWGLLRNESRASYCSTNAERSTPLPYCRLTAIRNGFSISTLLKQICPVKPTNAVLPEAVPAPWNIHQLYTGRLSLLKHWSEDHASPFAICISKPNNFLYQEKMHHFSTSPFKPTLTTFCQFCPPSHLPQLSPAALSLGLFPG